MIRSMTGYGSATAAGELGEFTVEIRSVNNRHLDVAVRLPKELGFLELAVREVLRRRIHRGKVDVFVKWTPSPGAPPLCEINLGLVRHYLEELSTILSEIPGASLDVGAVLALPGAVSPGVVATQTDVLEETARQATIAACAHFDQSRLEEGAALANALSDHLEGVERAVEAIEKLKPELDAAMLDRLAKRIRELAEAAGVSVEPGRIEMELALAADKADVTEELVRLRTHLAEFRRRLLENSDQPVGKIFDFLVQEIHRELTTLGNKARAPQIAANLLVAKNELEKIREQIQNIE